MFYDFKIWHHPRRETESVHQQQEEKTSFPSF